MVVVVMTCGAVTAAGGENEVGGIGNVGDAGGGDGGGL